MDTAVVKTRLSDDVKLEEIHVVSLAAMATTEQQSNNTNVRAASSKHNNPAPVAGNQRRRVKRSGQRNATHNRKEDNTSNKGTTSTTTITSPAPTDKEKQTYTLALHNTKLTRKQKWMGIAFGVVMMLMGMGLFMLTQSVKALYVFYPVTYFFTDVATGIIVYLVVLPYLPEDLRIVLGKIQE
jgi:hypothetical protein